MVVEVCLIAGAANLPKDQAAIREIKQVQRTDQLHYLEIQQSVLNTRRGGVERSRITQPTSETRNHRIQATSTVAYTSGGFKLPKLCTNPSDLSNSGDEQTSADQRTRNGPPKIIVEYQYRVDETLAFLPACLPRMDASRERTITRRGGEPGRSGGVRTVLAALRNRGGLTAVGAVTVGTKNGFR